MSTEKISNRQLWFILFIMRSSIIIASLPVLTSADALQDAWISALITLVGTEIIVFIISLLDIKFPNLSLIEYSSKLLGPYLGRLLSMVYLWVFLQLAAVEIRIYAEVIVTTFLPQTPMIFIIAMMVFAAAICVYSGIEVLGRTADVLFFVFIFMILGTILVALPYVKVDNIQPILARGWQPAISGALTPMALSLNMWVIGMLSSTTNAPKKILRTSLTALGSSLIMLVLISFVTIGVLGPYQGARANFPVLTLIRSVQVSKFLQRTEVLVIFAWGFGLFISVSTFLYSGAKGISLWLNLDDHRPLIFPMAVIWVVMSLHGFENIFAVNSFLKPEIFAPYAFTLLLVPLFLLWLSYIIKNIREEL